MITVEKLEKGTYFDDAFKISFRYDPTIVAKIKELAERRYLPEDRAWEIPAHELPALIEKLGLSNIKSEEAVVQALNTKEIEDKREATQERLKGIKPVRDFDFKTAPLPHQIEAFNYGMEKNSLLIGDEQGLGNDSTYTLVLLTLFAMITLCALPMFFAFIFRDMGKTLTVSMVLFFVMIFLLNSESAQIISRIIPMGQLRLISLQKVYSTNFCLFVDFLWNFILYFIAGSAFLHTDLK